MTGATLTAALKEAREALERIETDAYAASLRAEGDAHATLKRIELRAEATLITLRRAEARAVPPLCGEECATCTSGGDCRAGTGEEVVALCNCGHEWSEHGAAGCYVGASEQHRCVCRRSMPTPRGRGAYTWSSK